MAVSGTERHNAMSLYPFSDGFFVLTLEKDRPRLAAPRQGGDAPSPEELVSALPEGTDHIPPINFEAAPAQGARVGGDDGQPQPPDPITLGAPREAAGEVGPGKSERSGEIAPPTSDDLKAGEGVTLFRPPVLSHDEWELRQENLAAILRSRRFGEAVQIDVDGDALLGIEAHEFFLDDRLFTEGWSAHSGDPIVIHVNRPNAEIHHRAQRIADISGDCVLVPDIDEPTDWVVLTPNPMQKATGTIEYDATTGALCLRHGDGTRRRIRPEEHLERLKGAGFYKTAFEIGDKTVVVYRDFDEPALWQGDSGAVADDARDMLAKTRQLEAMDAPYVAKVHGIIEIYGCDALLMDTFASADRLLHSFQMHGKEVFQDLFDISLLTPKSIESLEATRAWLADREVYIDDLQFLIADDGGFYIADMEAVIPGEGPHPRNLKLIDEFIALAREAVAGRGAAADQPRNHRIDQRDRPAVSATNVDDLNLQSDTGPKSLSAAYQDPNAPWPKPESSIPEIFRNPRARQTSGLPSPSELLEGYVSPARIGLLGGGDQPGGVPRSPVKEVDADALEPKQGAEVALGPVPKLDLSQRGLRGRDGPPRIKTYMAITFGCVVFAAFPEHWRVPIAATAYAFRGAGFIAESMFPAAFAPDKRLGRALGGMYLPTWFANIEEGFRHFSDNVFNLLSNVPNQIGNWTYAGKKLQELLTGKAAFQNTDKLTLPLYFFGSIPSTIQSVQAGSEAGILAGSLIASGSAYLWVKSVRPTERKLDERLVLAGTFGVGLLLTSGIVWKALLEEEDKDKSEPATDNATRSPADGTSPDNPGDIPVDPEEPQEPVPQLVVTAEDGLNLREEPAALSDRVAVLRPGSLVRDTGECKTDEAGNEWISVQGYGWDGEEHQGWVMASFVAPHARGAQSEEGRYNPELESQGYHWVEVEPGQTVGNIAREHSVDVAEMVVLNMDHIVDPTMIFAGDRVYLPAAA